MSQNSPDSNTLLRRPITASLSRRFIQDVYAAIHNSPPVLVLDIVNHLLSVVDALEQYAATQDEQTYKTFWEGEEKFTAKWGRLAKPYRAQKFETYFDKISVLLEKGVLSIEEYSAMPSGEEQCTSEAEMKEVADSVRRFLEITRNTYLMEQPPSQEAMDALSKDPLATVYLESLGGIGEDESSKSGGRKGKHKHNGDGTEEDDSENGKAFGNTKTRSRLALYYLVKAGGVEPRADSAVSALAKLSHFITGEKLSTLNNSNTYKFYLSMPEYKTAKGRLDDLNYIRPFFEELGMARALELIDAEVIKTDAELPHKGRR